MTANSQTDRSPAPGIIPEPAHLSREVASPSAATRKLDNPKPGRRNPVSIALAKVARALRGDKYMVDAYPPAEGEGAATSDDSGARAR
jgi:hypothetical protein